jgi:hypothetical protein
LNNSLKNFTFVPNQKRMMKNSAVIVFLGLGLMGCKQDATSKIDVSSQVERTEVSLDQVDTPTDAKMDFEAIEWDFGDINQGDVVVHAFKFTNSGSDPLIITNAKGSCGCTVPEWPRAPVAPGESGVIDVKFNSKGKKGKQNKRVTLTTNMVPSQQILTVKGQVNLKEE